LLLSIHPPPVLAPRLREEAARQAADPSGDSPARNTAQMYDQPAHSSRSIRDDRQKSTAQKTNFVRRLKRITLSCPLRENNLLSFYQKIWSITAVPSR
jgi:hypothetical protein